MNGITDRGYRRLEKGWYDKPISTLVGIVGLLVIFGSAIAVVVTNSNENKKQNETDRRLENRINNNEQVINRVDRNIAAIEQGIDSIKENQSDFKEDVKEIKKSLDRVGK